MGSWPWLEPIQAGPGTQTLTCSPLSPGMPGMPRAPGTDCPGGPLSPCKGHVLSIWLLAAGVSALPSTREVLLSPCLHPGDARVGGDGDGSSPSPGQAGFQIPPLRLQPLGRGTQGRNPKPASWQGRTELGRDSRCHPPLTHEGDWALPSSEPQREQSPVVRPYLLALHALRTSWANAP